MRGYESWNSCSRRNEAGLVCGESLGRPAIESSKRSQMTPRPRNKQNRHEATDVAFGKLPCGFHRT